MSPVAMCLEELIPARHAKSHVYSILIRTALVISTLLVGLSIPFFGKFLAKSTMLNLLSLTRVLSLYPCLRLCYIICSMDPLLFMFAHGVVPFCYAGLVMALIGSLLTMLVVSSFILVLLFHLFTQRYTSFTPTRII